MHRYRCGLPYAIASWHSRRSRCGTFLLGVLTAGTRSTHCRYSEYSLRARTVPIARGSQSCGAAEQPEQVRRERGVPARRGQACCLQVGTPIVGRRVRVIGVRVQINGTRVQIAGISVQITGISVQITGIRVQIIGLAALTADCTKRPCTFRDQSEYRHSRTAQPRRPPTRAPPRRKRCSMLIMPPVARLQWCTSHVYNAARCTLRVVHVARGYRRAAAIRCASSPSTRSRIRARRSSCSSRVRLGPPDGATECLARPAPASATGLGPPRPTSAPGLALQGTTRGRRTSSGSRRTAASRRTRAGPRARRRVSTRVPRASFPARRALERRSHRPRLARFHPSLARSRKEEHRLRWFGIAAAEGNRSQDISACNATQLALVETAHAQWLGKLAPLTDPVRLYDRTGGPTGINGNGYGCSEYQYG